MIAVGLRSLAVRFPRAIRTNDHWRQRYPAVVADAEERTLARLWKPDGDTAARPFDEAARPYLQDPFRGAVERRVCGDGEDSLTLEREAARAAVEAAGLDLEEVDLLIASSFRARHVGTGNAAFLARDLGLTCNAFNLETACTGAVASLQTAVGLVRAGLYRRVLVVVSCTYTLDTDEQDTLSWFMGDGAGAFVVSEVAPGQGYLGGSFVHTGNTCDAFAYRPTVDPQTQAVRMRIVAGPKTGLILRQTSAGYVRRCCFGALQEAGLTTDDIRCFVFNTPTAWFAEFAAQVLGVAVERAVNTNPLYANIGPALTTANLHFAARTGRIAPGDAVLIYAIGSVSSAGAVVLRWGDVALGPDPDRVYDRPLPTPLGPRATRPR